MLSDKQSQYSLSPTAQLSKSGLLNLKPCVTSESMQEVFSLI